VERSSDITLGHASEDPSRSTEARTLKALAYRLLGTVADAEDAVQETYARWYALNRDERGTIRAPIAWMRTTLTRLCLDRLKSSRHKREVYVGEWLPEPVSGADFWCVTTDRRPNEADLSDSVSMALMIVLDKMTPPERIAFILHHAFQYTFDDIGEIIDRTPQACRQLAFSARKRLEKDARRRSNRDEHARVNDAFREAWMTGDVTALIAVLDTNAEAVADGGGKAAARIDPILGCAAIVEFFMAILRQQPTLRVESQTVNGEPGLVGMVGDQVISVVSTAVKDGKIHNIWAMRNPDKLGTWH
jgi:RNA polymerase sigma factor (sigma-70 family)